MAASLLRFRSSARGFLRCPRLPPRPIRAQARHVCRGPPWRSLPEPWHTDNAPAGLTGEAAAAWSSRCKAWCYSLGVTEELLCGRKAPQLDEERVNSSYDRCRKCSSQSYSRILTVARPEGFVEEEYFCLNPDCKHRWTDWS